MRITIHEGVPSDPLVRYAESAWKRLKLEPPVDLDSVRRFLKIRLSKKPLDPEICGMYIVTSKGRRMIQLNSLLDLSPTRKRWTIAHELGHHLMLPRDAAPGAFYDVKDNFTAELSGSTDEVRANRFAAELLMPHWLVNKWYDELYSNPTGRIIIMADRFGVSISAMMIRLRELRLQSRNTSVRKRIIKEVDWNKGE
ncbi:MAG: ImmA/IrrE family metallo-endopeptidase [Armatimonadota bacterium]